MRQVITDGQYIWSDQGGHVDGQHPVPKQEDEAGQDDDQIDDQDETDGQDDRDKTLERSPYQIWPGVNTSPLVGGLNDGWDDQGEYWSR